MTEDTAILVPITDEELDLLEWFAQWTPAVHQARWDVRRAWPPGFREMSDTSVYNSEKLERYEREMSIAPVGLGAAKRPLAYGLIEGHWHVYRLTPRGRAALLHHERYNLPAWFESHCPDVFDSVDLRLCVTSNDYMESLYVRAKPLGLKHGDLYPDTPETWRAALVEYREGDYHGSHTLTKATACLTRFSGECFMNGSLRKHNGGMSLTINSNDERNVLRLRCSLEQMADLLTGQSSTPVTLDHYIGSDGMSRSEPAPPTISTMRRMKERARLEDEGMDDAIKKMKAEIDELIEKKRITKTVGRQLTMLFERMRGRDGSWIAHQAIEEVSMAVESMLTIGSERLALDDSEHDALRASTALLLSGTVNEPHEEDS